MKHESISRARVWRAGAVVLALVLGLAVGCKNQPASRTDQQISTDVQAKINGEGALNGQNIQVSVANGVATLSGTVTDEASRALAGNDSGTVDGVKTVVNNLTVQPAQQTTAAPAAPPAQSAAPPIGSFRTRQAAAPRSGSGSGSRRATTACPGPGAAGAGRAGRASAATSASTPSPCAAQAGGQGSHAACRNGHSHPHHGDARLEDRAGQ